MGYRVAHKDVTAGQKATLALDVEKLYAEEAKKKQVRTAENRVKTSLVVPAPV